MPRPPAAHEKDEIVRGARRRRFWKGFLAGVGLGTVVSVLTWFPVEMLGNATAEGLLWFLPVLKVCFGVVLVRNPRWRGFGAGILVSIPIGVLVALASCVSAMK